MSDASISRRNILKTAGLTAASLVAPGALALESPDRLQTRKHRVLRFAHLTDIHVMAERKAAQGFEKCLEHVQSLKDPPNLIVTGGDMIMDALNCDSGRVKGQWDIFHRVLKGNNSLPVEHCIGNHDVFGWGNCAAYKNQSLYGKKWVQDELELVKPYRSFDRAGWHFVVLDSTHPIRGNGYCAKLDTDQFEWFVDDLATVPSDRPVVVISHMPIVSSCAFFHGDNERYGRWSIPSGWMHLDARRIKDVFNRHSNVKLCVSGHIHLIDRVNYCGVTYTCRGAVSAGWWSGDFQECTFGYSLFDLYSDWSFFTQYVPFGWNAAE